MATPTYTLIESYTASSTVTSFSFTSIPGTYRDLVLVLQPNWQSQGWQMRMTINNDSTSTYASVTASGNGSSTDSRDQSAGQHYFELPFDTGFGAAGYGNLMIMQAMDYAQTDKHKTFLFRTNNQGTYNIVQMVAARVATTSALSSIEFTISGSNLLAGTSAKLFGIAG